MRRLSYVVLAVVLVLSLVVPAAVTPTAADGGDGGTDGQYSLEFLASDGTEIHSEYVSVRNDGGSQYFWIVRYPPSGLASYGSSSNEEFIESSTTVRRNKIRVYTDEGTGEDKTEFVIVYWNRATREVQTENGTTTEPYADIEAVERAKVDLEDGFQPSADISLRGHYQNASHVTMWKAGNREVKWSFKHKSVATATPVNLNSQSDLQNYIVLWVVLPGLVAVLAGQRIGGYFNRGGGAGPNRRGLLLGGGIFAALAMWVVGYVALASLIVTLPVSWALALGWASFVNAWDQQNAVESVAFIRMDTEMMPSPLESVDDLEDRGDEGDLSQILDSIGAELVSHDLVEMPSGESAVYKEGFDAWYARFSGCYTRMVIRNEMATVDLSDGSEFDRLVFVEEDPETEIVEHTPERTIVAWPWRTYEPDDPENPTDEDLQYMSVLPTELDTENYLKSAAVIAAFAGSCLAARQYLGSWLWGTLAYVPLRFVFATPVRGYAHTRVAKGLARAAWTTAFYQQIAVKRFGSIQDMAKTILRLDEKEQNLVEALREARDEQSITADATDRKSMPFESEMVEDDPARGATGGDD
ncbi:hypothetical protein ELS19_17205 [Halogeometricum borinquense]|uniref:DUF2207 domain-containing protein n=1 Tax=Halogeometricum borinquense TaxID=60847 RepID=A0A482TB89_9EURY|nr:hypothetical protein [Halogeometricum borinquense]RYJ08293.1 hypothetical protein ELS19_17205 [Halogeometricum borinquense]